MVERIALLAVRKIFDQLVHFVHVLADFLEVSDLHGRLSVRLDDMQF